MNSLFEVREYDSIMCNGDFEKDQRFRYLNKREFKKLTEFIRTAAADPDNADLLQFMSITQKPYVGEIVTIKNYVGLIQLPDGFQIQILPKIDFSKDDKTGVRTKKIFLKMLRSMKDFPAKIFNNSNFSVAEANLYEIFIHIYLQEVRRLVQHGIKSDYIPQRENSAYMKGKLLFAEQIRYNRHHKERFYVRYDVFHPDRPENRIIKATLYKLSRQTPSLENSKEIKQLLTAFESVKASINYSADFSRVHISRNTDDYKNLMQWSKVFLMNESMTAFSGNTFSKELLFPMERVYESYIAQQIRKTFASEEWNVSVQDKGSFLFEEPRSQFALRPDIVLEKDNRLIVMDTKWKRLNNTSSNYGISQSDMYQMYAYSRKYNTSEIWVLYPLNHEMRDHESISFSSRDIQDNDTTNVNIYFVDLENIENSMQMLKEKVV